MRTDNARCSLVLVPETPESTPINGAATTAKRDRCGLHAKESLHCDHEFLLLLVRVDRRPSSLGRRCGIFLTRYAFPSRTGELRGPLRR